MTAPSAPPTAASPRAAVPATATASASDTARAEREPATPAPTPEGRAAIYSALGWGAQLGWQLLLSRALIRGAGDETWGLWAVIAAFKAFVVFLDGGIAQVVVRDAAAGDSQSSARLASARRLALVAAGLALLISLGGAPFVAGYLQLSPAVANVAWPLVLVHGLDAAIALAAGPLPAMLRGHGQFGLLALGSAAQAGVGLLLLTALMPMLGALGAAIAVVGARASIAAAQWWWLRRHRLLPTIASPTGTPVRLWPVLAAVLPVWATVAANQVAMRADVPIVGRCFSAMAAGHYELGQQLPTAAMSLLAAIMAFALPRFCADVARGDHAALHQRLPRVVFMACLLAGLGFVALAGAAEDLLVLWVGNAPPLAVNVARIYCAAWAVNAAVHVLVQVAVAHGRFAMLAWPTLLTSLANFGLSLLLANGGIAAGPAWATLLMMAVSDLVVVPFLLVRALRLPAAAIARAAGIGWLVGGVGAAATLWLASAVAAMPSSRAIVTGVAVAVVAAIALDVGVRERSVVRALLRR